MEACMWTRRLLLATMVAAAAMSLPRQLPAFANGQSAQTIAANAFRRHGPRPSDPNAGATNAGILLFVGREPTARAGARLPGHAGIAGRCGGVSSIASKEVDRFQRRT
jgi:hypothetical protein